MRATAVAVSILVGSACRPARTGSLLAVLLIAAASHAQDRGPAGEGESTWGLGFGVVSSQKPYAGTGREARLLPMLQFENRYLRVQGLGFEVKLPGLAIGDSQRLQFGIVGRAAPGAGYEADDSPVLGGMARRKSGFWVGAKVEWRNPLVNVSADWTADAAGHSKGQKFSLGINKPWRLGSQVLLVPRLGATWQDRRHNDYYFGVRDDEARPNRPAYRADAGVNLEAGLIGTYLVSRHHSLMMGLGASRLPREISNSPLVDRSTENRAFMAYIYRF